MIEFSGIFGIETFSALFGTGYRINEKAIFRLNAGIYADRNDAYANLMLNLETTRYRIGAMAGFGLSGSQNIVQISCAYKLGYPAPPTLLRLN